MIYTNDYESPLGSILLAGDEQGLTGLWFTEGARYVGLGLQKGARRCETEYFEQVKKWLDIYFSGLDPGFLDAGIVTDDAIYTIGYDGCSFPNPRSVQFSVSFTF